MDGPYDFKLKSITLPFLISTDLSLDEYRELYPESLEVELSLNLDDTVDETYLEDASDTDLDPLLFSFEPPSISLVSEVFLVEEEYAEDRKGDPASLRDL